MLSAPPSSRLYTGRSFPDIHECPDCGLFNELPHVSAGIDLCCTRCDKSLRFIRSNSLNASMAYALVGLFFYIVAVFSPFLRVTIYNWFRVSTIIDGPLTLADEGLWILGSFVLLTTLAVPLIRILGTLAVLVSTKGRQPPSWAITLFGWLKHLTPWAMTDVYLLGLLVAYTRLQAMMQVMPGEAVIALAGVMLGIAGIDAMLDKEEVWERLKNPVAKTSSFSQQGPLIGCDNCHQVNHGSAGEACARCGVPLQIRKPESIARSCAFMLAAVIFYIPSNIFPVMTITKYGHRTDYTILGGIQELAHVGLLPIAVLVFIVSIVIPLFKLISLTFLLIATHRGSVSGLYPRTSLYRVIDFIGRWSMLDVFAVSILASVIHFGQANQITAEKGIFFFASVVMLTLFAMENFDPRLMWDAANAQPASVKGTLHD